MTLPTSFHFIRASREMVTSAVPVIKTSDLREEDAQKQAKVGRVVWKK